LEKKKRQPILVAAVAAALKSDHHFSVLAVAQTKGALAKTDHYILTND